MARTGDRPCAVPASALIALYSTFITKPINILLEGTTRIISDICGEALEVARRNVEAHSLLDRIEIIKSDCFNDLNGRKFDLIVCNPPYVDSQEFAAMPSEYRHEPARAMLSGEDGLEFTRQLLREAIDYLNPHGILVVEVGHSALALQQEFTAVPFIWPSVGEGDSGVFILSHDQLDENRNFFS